MLWRWREQVGRVGDEVVDRWWWYWDTSEVEGKVREKGGV